MRALQAAMAEPWAITAEGLELVLQVAGRETATSIEALEAYRAKHVPTAERMTQRGNVAILEARGPMFRHASLFTSISGATSYDVMRRDLQTALDDPNIRAIVLTFDTPGGVVTGVDELAKAIADGKARKPIVAYVGGAAASAGYWLASQATEIVIDATAVLGSIGVRAVVNDTTEADAKAGKLEFISSQSPGKRADLSSDEGRGRVQRVVDALADVFIATVAKGRGVKPDIVTGRFGGGDVLVGAAAVAAGMADRIGSFEAVIAELADGKTPKPTLTPRRTAKMENDEMVSRADHNAAIEAAKAEGSKSAATGERDRIKAICGLEEAKGREASALHLATTTDLSVEAVRGVLAGLPTAPVAAPTEPAPPKPEGIQRSADAPSGLITVDPSSEPALAAEKSKAVWGKTIEALNKPYRAA